MVASQWHKPRIFIWPNPAGKWVCSNGVYMGCGASPAEAYWACVL